MCGEQWLETGNPFIDSCENMRMAAEWLANSTGASSQTMVFWLAFCVRKADFMYYPSDVYDFEKCENALKALPFLRKDLHKMAECSKNWELLVENWEKIESITSRAEKNNFLMRLTR